ncbi:hypothetical protein BBSC_0586 [Bifidobacterium scardovii JCM 12489 = DSM 13734]|nr:hypothetical protein BBSC_0586 [Bifidobacterium scardovii JCM 12489 = DSM 13734]
MQPFPTSSIPPASRIRLTPHGCHPTNSGAIQPRQAPRFFPLTPYPTFRRANASSRLWESLTGRLSASHSRRSTEPSSH